MAARRCRQEKYSVGQPKNERHDSTPGSRPAQGVTRLRQYPAKCADVRAQRERVKATGVLVQLRIQPSTRIEQIAIPAPAHPEALAQRRGVAAGTNALTVHGCTGTIDVADIVADNGIDLLEIIGKSLAFAGTNAFIATHHGAEIMVAIAPPWADLIARAYPNVDDVHERLWAHAALPVSWWPQKHQQTARGNGRVDEAGLVHLVEGPGHMIVTVCGGLGNLHALALHSFGPTRAVTRAF